MKKKICICLIVLLVIGGLSVLAYVKWNTSTMMAECHKRMSESNMLANSVSFSMEQKGDVKIKVRSSVDEGDVKITLQKESGEILHSFQANCEIKETMSLDAGDYDIRVDSDMSKADFDVVVRK